MRRFLAFAIAASALLAPVLADDSAKTAPDAKAKLVGTWESTPRQDGTRQLKYITPTHFVWVIYDVEKKTPLGSAGGTWTLKGDTYKETVDFAADGWEHLRGKTVELTSKVDGDKWTVQGTLDTGFKIDETWERQKSRD